MTLLRKGTESRGRRSIKKLPNQALGREMAAGQHALKSRGLEKGKRSHRSYKGGGALKRRFYRHYL